MPQTKFKLIDFDSQTSFLVLKKRYSLFIQIRKKLKITNSYTYIVWSLWGVPPFIFHEDQHSVVSSMRSAARIYCSVFCIYFINFNVRGRTKAGKWARIETTHVIKNSFGKNENNNLFKFNQWTKNCIQEFYNQVVYCFKLISTISSCCSEHWFISIFYKRNNQITSNQQVLLNDLLYLGRKKSS